MAIEKILVLEDNEVLNKNLAYQLRERRYNVQTAGTLAAARELLAKMDFDLMFVDLGLPDGRGGDLLQELQARPQRPLAIVTTGTVSVQAAVECMRYGAFDYVTKPYAIGEIETCLEKAEKFTQLVNVNQHLSQQPDDETERELLGQSPAMRQLRELVRRVARTEATVLIHGESGTGKELVARALYDQSPRADAPFIRVNCAAVPENLIESEFFGHEKGAFTGALNKREGRFELAHGGTILLDEVSEVSINVQAKLLRVLQERELERVGGTRTIKVDVRVIATSNRQLEESIARKEFRQDLYFRLNVVPIHVPPLRERPEDIEFLAGRFIDRFARKHGRTIRGASTSALTALNAHSWPGNVRELQNVMERAVILCGDTDLIEVGHLGSLPVDTLTPTRAPGERTAAEENFLTLDQLERRHIIAALDRTGDNRTHAARLLGISVRTLRNKLHEYNGTGHCAVPELVAAN